MSPLHWSSLPRSNHQTRDKRPIGKKLAMEQEEQIIGNVTGKLNDATPWTMPKVVEMLPQHLSPMLSGFDINYCAKFADLEWEAGMQQRFTIFEAQIW
jgi:hypothetical protein